MDGPKSSFRGLFESPTQRALALDAAERHGGSCKRLLLVDFCVIIFIGAKYSRPWYTVVHHDRLESLPPKEYHNILNSRETLSRGNLPSPTAALISHAT